LPCYIWNRVFDNSLFSSALSGKSSCQQFRRSSLCLSTVYTHISIWGIKIRRRIYIYYLIINGRQNSTCVLTAWLPFVHFIFI
jgi:hypothetical protein